MAREVLREWTADHRLDERRFVELAGRARRHVTAVAQDRDGVAQPEDLLHPVADVDHRDAGLAQPSDQLVQLLRLVLREAARRLVEDDDARAASDRGGDLEHLLLAGAQLVDLPVHVDRGADGRRASRRRAGASRARDRNGPRRGQRAEAEVFGDGQVLAERELLVDDRDTGRQRLFRTAECHGLPKMITRPASTG